MRNKLVGKVIVRFLMAIVMLGLLLFLPAGTIYYWHAWAFLSIFFISLGLTTVYLFRHDRALLERRMKMSEKDRSQKFITRIGALPFLALFLISGFDFRYGWSSVSITVIILAYAISISGYYLFFLTLKENHYASRVIEVEKEQKVISTGPYAFVRHPMYLSVLLMLGFIPLCLGSYWSVPLLIPIFLVLVFRILSEERVLMESLPGYKEYVQKTKYRLIPSLW